MPLEERYFPVGEISKESYIRKLEAEGWDVSEVTLNEVDFANVITTAVSVIGTSTAVVTVQPPSGAEVRILKNARVWLYLGDGAGEVNAFSNVSVKRLRANGDDNRIDNGIYQQFSQRDEERVHRMKRNILVTPADKLRFLVNSNITTTVATTKFALDAFILQRRA